MGKQTRKAELEALCVLYLESMCHGAGLDASGSKAQLIGRLLKSEGQVPAEPEPTASVTDEPETQGTEPETQGTEPETQGTEPEPEPGAEPEPELEPKPED